METTQRAGYKPSKQLTSNIESTPLSKRFKNTLRHDVVYPAPPHKPTVVQRHDAPFYQTTDTNSDGVVYRFRPARSDPLLPFRGLLDKFERVALCLPFHE